MKFLGLALEYSLPVLSAIVISLLITYSLWHGRLGSWRDTPRGSGGKKRKKASYLDFWAIYLVGGLLSLVFGGVIGGSVALPNVAPSSLLLLPVLLTMTGIGMFRVLCIVLPQQSPNIIVVWFTGSTALGLFLTFSGVAASLPSTTVISGQLLSDLWDAFAIAILASVLITLGVEILINLVIRAQVARIFPKIA